MSKITVETQNVYKTSDGKSWTDAAAASGHQALLDHGGLIDGYIKAHPATFAVQGAEGRARGVLAPFLGWLAMQDGCTLPEPVVTEAAAPEAAAA